MSMISGLGDFFKAIVGKSADAAPTAALTTGNGYNPAQSSFTSAQAAPMASIGSDTSTNASSSDSGESFGGVTAAQLEKIIEQKMNNKMSNIVSSLNKKSRAQQEKDEEFQQDIRG